MLVSSPLLMRVLSLCLNAKILSKLFQVLNVGSHLSEPSRRPFTLQLVDNKYEK